MFNIFHNIQSESAIAEIMVPLRCVDFFRTACPESTKVDNFIKQSIPFFSHEKYEQGRAIFHYGDVGDKFYIVLKGKVGV